MAGDAHELDYDVDLDSLAAVLVALRAERDVLGALAADVESEVALLHEEWHGAGATAHDAAHSRWSADLAVMDTALLALHELVALAGDNYAAAAAASLRAWQQLR